MHVHTIQMKMFALQPRRWKCSLFFADGEGSKKGQNIDIGHVVNNEKCWIAVCKASAATQKKTGNTDEAAGGQTIDHFPISDEHVLERRLKKAVEEKSLKKQLFLSSLGLIDCFIGAHRGYLKKNRTKSQFYFNDEKFTPQIGLMMQEFVV